jgi:hypothetical protein
MSQKERERERESNKAWKTKIEPKNVALRIDE